MKVFTAEQMRAFDRAATEQYRIPSIVLMENAALRVVEFLELKFAPLRGKHVVVLAGKGNNGGDGFVIARHLVNAGCEVKILLTAAASEFKGDALTNFEILQSVFDRSSDHASLQIVVLNGQKTAFSPTVRESLRFTDIVVDALLGTGFNGELRSDAIAQALSLVSQIGGTRVAIDVVSGLDSDTGEAVRDADFGPGEKISTLQADYTVTFAAPKRGQFVRDGLELSGEIWIGSIGTPQELMAEARTGCECLTREVARKLLPHRKLDSHKGDAGRVLVIGGSEGMVGAPTMASRASLRVGAGLCITCLPEKVLASFAAAFSEATSHGLPCDEKGRFTIQAAEMLPDLWENVNVVALGPGLSRADGALELARHVVRECPHPLLIDADALYALRAIADDVKNRKAPTILTPHPGEMGELMNMETKAVQADRIGTAVACAKQYNAFVVLKGSRSIVATPDGSPAINLTGNSGMATGGSGDVLTGTISGLLAQTKEAESATRLGVYLHGLAGDLVHEQKGNGLIAGDIAEALPFALQNLAHIEPDSHNDRLWKLA